MSGVLAGLIGSLKSGPAGAFESIASATGTGSSATITFSSIPSTYQSLQLRIVTKGSATGGGDSYVWLRVNGATGTVYSAHHLYGNGASVLAGAYSTANEMEGILQTINSGATQTNVCSVGIIDFHDYASTTRNKTIRAITGYDNNGAGEVRLASGLYQSTTAISSISLIYQGGSGAWTTQTQVALYGIKGA